ncbi:DUF1015 domain-containing protein [Treponema pedis]|uniref:DUF1015 domain-containing protein n=1 Tax=Treponema pedis TaxID=409322 RepID=UPI00040388F1|nr:DUF1015 domain-containing protein [Treponema pedis]
MNIFEKYALKTPDILLPGKLTDFSVWAVIACDQYTQDKEYWDKVQSITKNKHSARHIILPEFYLHNLSEKQRREEVIKIHNNMQNYIKNAVFAEPISSMIYVERKTFYGRTRKGLITCIDLEKYDWKKSSKAEIRATEATIVDRLPPRMEIRRAAPIELPHIMLLANDYDNILIGELEKNIHKTEVSPIYNFDLMMNAGSISGWAIPQELSSAVIKPALEKLYKNNTGEDGSTFMFAVGDGNHSLAAAKAVWEEFKQKTGAIPAEDGSVSIPKSIENHPLRYALVEIVNLYDSGLTFEPIHRILFDTDGKNLTDFIQSKLGGTLIKCKSEEELLNKVESSTSSFGFISEREGLICLETNLDCLAISAIQPLLDEFTGSEKKIDYIHGTDEAFRLSEKVNSVSVLLPPISKINFFSTIAEYGSLPRKSFSMGEASEKRFYLECRSLS